MPPGTMTQLTPSARRRANEERDAAPMPSQRQTWRHTGTQSRALLPSTRTLRKGNSPEAGQHTIAPTGRMLCGSKATTYAFDGFSAALSSNTTCQWQQCSSTVVQ